MSSLILLTNPQVSLNFARGPGDTAVGRCLRAMLGSITHDEARCMTNDAVEGDSDMANATCMSCKMRTPLFAEMVKSILCVYPSLCLC